MNVCIIGDGLTSLSLAKNLINKKINVDLYQQKKIENLLSRQTIGVAKNNLDFCYKYDNKNKELLKKIEFVKERINKKLPTIPVTLENELKTNIFLRCDNPSVKNALNLNNSSELEIFVKLRDLKDNF